MRNILKHTHVLLLFAAAIVILLIYIFTSQQIRLLFYKPVQVTLPPFKQSGWKTYKDKLGTYSFSYPNTYTPKEGIYNNDYSRVEIVGNPDATYIADASACDIYQDGYISISTFQKRDPNQDFERFFLENAPADLQKSSYKLYIHGHLAYKQNSLVYIDNGFKYIQIYSCKDSEEFNSLISSFKISQSPKYFDIYDH